MKSDGLRWGDYPRFSGGPLKAITRILGGGRRRSDTWKGGHATAQAGSGASRPHTGRPAAPRPLEAGRHKAQILPWSLRGERGLRTPGFQPPATPSVVIGHGRPSERTQGAKTPGVCVRGGGKLEAVLQVLAPARSGVGAPPSLPGSQGHLGTWSDSIHVRFPLVLLQGLPVARLPGWDALRLDTGPGGTTRVGGAAGGSPDPREGPRGAELPRPLPQTLQEGRGSLDRGLCSRGTLVDPARLSGRDMVLPPEAPRHGVQNTDVSGGIMWSCTDPVLWTPELPPSAATPPTEWLERGMMENTPLT